MPSYVHVDLILELLIVPAYTCNKKFVVGY